MTIRRGAVPVALVLFCAPASAQQNASASYCGTYDLPSSKLTEGYFGPMTYRTVSGPDGLVLLAEGAILPGEAARMATAIARAGQVEEVWFNSSGGDAREGPQMGRFLRQKGIAVRLKSAHACVSACSYAFLGGSVRVVEPGAHYGVHMFTSARNQPYMLSIVAEGARLNAARPQLLRKGASPAQADTAVAEAMGDVFRGVEQEAAKTAAIRARYLVEMSLSLDFMTDAFGTDANKICYLSPAGLARYNVSNAQ